MRAATIEPVRRLAKRALAALAGLSLGLGVAGGAAAQQALTPADYLLYQAAFQAADIGAWDTARGLIGRANDPLPGKVLRAIDLARVDGDASFADIAAFIRANPSWPTLTALRLQAERAMPAEMPAAEAIAWFESYPPLTFDATLRYALTLRGAGREADAAAYVRERWRTIQITPFQKEQLLAAFGHALSRHDHETRLDALLWARRDTEARRMFELVGPGHRALADARLRLAERTSGVDTAVSAVPSELANHEGLVFERARWRRIAERTGPAIELLAYQPAETAQPNAWWGERNILSRRLFNNGDMAGAYRVVSDHRLSGGFPYSQAEWFAGFLALRFLDRPQQAFEHFVKLYDAVASPISWARGAYWAARAQERLGNAAEAERWYLLAAEHDTAFYGQLANDRLGRPSVGGLASEPAIAPEVRDAFQQREFVRIVRALHQLGREDLMLSFFNRIMSDADTEIDYALLGDLALAMGNRYLAVRTGKAAVADGLHVTAAAYPLLPLDAANGRVEPALLLALIRQESEFRIDAVSHAGARGLMQLMPATAQLTANRLGVPHHVDRLTTDPAHNIQLGSEYLAQMLDRYNGSYILAVAAYNAGPGRVDSWLPRLGDPRSGRVDVLDWIESIPIYETRNYVQRVLENVQTYRLRLGAPLTAGALERDLAR